MHKPSRTRWHDDIVLKAVDVQYNGVEGLNKYTTINFQFELKALEPRRRTTYDVTTDIFVVRISDTIIIDIVSGDLLRLNATTAPKY
jgi:hypothetical protein